MLTFNAANLALGFALIATLASAEVVRPVDARRALSRSEGLEKKDLGLAGVVIQGNVIDLTPNKRDVGITVVNVQGNFVDVSPSVPTVPTKRGCDINLTGASIQGNSIGKPVAAAGVVVSGNAIQLPAMPSLPSLPKRGCDINLTGASIEGNSVGKRDCSIAAAGVVVSGNAIQLSSMPSLPLPSLGSLPSLPSLAPRDIGLTGVTLSNGALLPAVPAMPTLPQVPTLPSLSNGLPSLNTLSLSTLALPQVPTLPTIPNLNTLALPSLSSLPILKRQDAEDVTDQDINVTGADVSGNFIAVRDFPDNIGLTAISIEGNVLQL
ncbi:hypothetical protein RQP46_006905 [Phenoliferia psychrophenolica]